MCVSAICTLPVLTDGDSLQCHGNIWVDTKDKQLCFQSQNSVLLTTLSRTGFQSRWTFCPEKDIDKVRYYLRGDDAIAWSVGSTMIWRSGDRIPSWRFREGQTALVSHHMLPQMLLSSLWNLDLSRAHGSMKGKRIFMIIVTKQLSRRRKSHLY